MRSAIVTDIHADRVRFTAVLADIAGRSIDRVVFLGDYLGHGRDGDWVLARVMDMVRAGGLALRGNHDRTAPALGLSLAARRVVDKTVNSLTPVQRQFLESLPLTLCHGGEIFAHACAARPQDWPYITDARSAAPSFAACDAALIFVGHSHKPALFAQGKNGQITPQPFVFDVEMPIMGRQRLLAVVGAVSDAGTGCAQYCIHDSDAASLMFRRIEFPAERATPLRFAGRVAPFDLRALWPKSQRAGKAYS